MPVQAFPILQPFQIDPGPTAAIYPLMVEAVGFDAPAATAVARAMAVCLSLIRGGHAPAVIAEDRTRIGVPGPPILGPYAYLLPRRNQVLHLAFPAALQGAAAEELRQVLEGLDPRHLYGVIFDLALLGGCSSEVLAAWMHHAKRFPLLLCHLPDTLLHQLKISGLDRFLTTCSDLGSCLRRLARICNPSLGTGGFRVQQPGRPATEPAV